MFRNRGLAAGSVNLFVVFAVMFALFLVLVQFLQAVLGYTALRAAQGCCHGGDDDAAVNRSPRPSPNGSATGAPSSPACSLSPVASSSCAVLADPDGGYLSVLPGMLVLGAGVGLSMSPSTAAITSSLPEEKQGVASALNDTVREMGGAVGHRPDRSVLNSGYRANITDPPTPPTRRRRPHQRRHRRRTQLRRPARTRRQPALITSARNAYVDGMEPALLLAAGLAVLAAAYTTWTGVQDKRRQTVSENEQLD